jgi:hypothetical protein
MGLAFTAALLMRRYSYKFGFIVDSGFASNPR